MVLIHHHAKVHYTNHQGMKGGKRYTIWENVKIYIKADEFPSQPKNSVNFHRHNAEQTIEAREPAPNIQRNRISRP